MTSEKLKPTPGPWLLDSNYAEDWDTPNHELNTSTSSQAILSPDDEIVAFAVVSYDQWNDPVKEAQLTANALLIAEAGTVHHECGLSPRELLAAVRDMRDALEGSLDAWDCLCSVQGWDKDHLAHAPNARAALAKHKEV